MSTTTGTRWALAIDRDDIAAAEIVAEGVPVLAPHQIEIRLERCAMTANNVTYAALGKPIGLFGNDKGYWDFFSTPGAPGRLPVWGFGEIVRSEIATLAPGERFYGYFPLASHCVLTPARVDAAGFADATPHRLDMPSIYNGYQRATALGEGAETDRDWWPVFRPLYLTGWLIADQLADENDYGAEQVLVVSASSKTAVACAHAMRQRARRPRTIGLTSERGRTFLEAADLYDALVLYDDIGSVPVAPTAIVDIAGDERLVGALHDRLGGEIKLDLVVGKSHWQAGGQGRWSSRSFFFAPERVDKRIEDWGPAGFRDQAALAWNGFLADARKLFHFEYHQGADGARAAYRAAVAGTADPRAGVLIVA